MPQTISAKKSLRKDRRRQLVNRLTIQKVKKAITSVRKGLSGESLKEASSFLDQAVKKDVLHKNKASRLKSRLAKLVGKATIQEKVKAWEKTSKKKRRKK